MQGKLAWTFAITTIALFMTALDNLVVVTALPQIQKDLGASLTQLEWVVNAYTLTFAVLLLTGAALGDRFGRKRLFVIGLSIFTVASVIAALSTGTEMLIVARAIQGLGARDRDAAHADDPRGGHAAREARRDPRGVGRDRRPRRRDRPDRRRCAHRRASPGSGSSGSTSRSASSRSRSRGSICARRRARPTSSTSRASSLAVVGLFCIVWGVVRSNTLGWGSPEVLGFIVAGFVIMGVFVWIEARSKAPMLPMRFFRSRAFSAANGASVAMYFGMFGSIFLLTQFLQTVQGYSPLGAGLRMLAWTGVTMLVAPGRGHPVRPHRRPAADGGRARAAGGRARLDGRDRRRRPSRTRASWSRSSSRASAWASSSRRSRTSCSRRCGWQEQGQASGANNALRELGGVFGIAVLAAIFANQGGYVTPQHFIDGLTPAVWVGAVVVGIGAVDLPADPAQRRRQAVGAPRQGDWSQGAASCAGRPGPVVGRRRGDARRRAATR